MKLLIYAVNHEDTPRTLLDIRLLLCVLVLQRDNVKRDHVHSLQTDTAPVAQRLCRAGTRVVVYNFVSSRIPWCED